MGQQELFTTDEVNQMKTDFGITCFLWGICCGLMIIAGYFLIVGTAY